MKNQNKTKKFEGIKTGLFGSLLIATLIINACSPVPRRTLSKEEKQADMLWIYSQLGENYAPLELKEKLHGFNYEDLKKAYLEKAQSTQTNEDFYKVMFEFVSQFKDAHTSASLNESPLPNRVQVAYLGFSGIRKGDALLVRSLLPTYKSLSFPIQVDDEITAVNGKSLKEIVDTEMVKSRDLGLKEANYTYHFNKIFNRVSITNSIPADDSITLTVKRYGKPFEVTLPWIKKDLVEFSKEQAEAKKQNSSSAPNPFDDDQVIQIGNQVLDSGAFIGANFELLPDIFKKIDRRFPKFDFRNTFEFIDDLASLNSKILKDTLGKAIDLLKLEGFSSKTITAGTKLDELKKSRIVPSKALFLENAKTFPTFITNESIKDSTGKATNESALVATIYLDTFSIGDEAVSEIKQTLNVLKQNGVKKVIIDMIDNGGGSLTHGVQIAQAFSNKKLILPQIQFKLSDTWLDEFHQDALKANSDTEKELSRRVLKALEEDKASGKRLSRNFSIETLMPYALKPNTNLDSPFEVVIMVNEMCASMCDIFTAIMQDNKLATVVGTQTMGAGGNVVNHTESPNAHLALRQTESLIIRADGSYIENNGVKPDVQVAVNNYTDTKYQEVRNLAIELLTTKKVTNTSVSLQSNTDTQNQEAETFPVRNNGFDEAKQ